MQLIKIKFVDFWYGFAPDDNYFFKLLSTFYLIELSDEPDFIIYSCFGKEYLKYSCLRVFYSAERLSADFTGCDFALTFDYSNDKRHFRFPLYGIYIDQAGSIEQLQKQKTREEALIIWKSKTKFCCLVVSNGAPRERINFFHELSNHKPVDSGGNVLNNVGGPVKDKMDFIKDYRFVIAYENKSYPGYTTEKIVEPFLADSIPIYWGNSLVEKDFNKASFLNRHDFASGSDFINQIFAIDNNEDLAVEMLMQPVFKDNIIPGEIDKQKLLGFFIKVVASLSSGYEPVAKTWRRFPHAIRIWVQWCKSLGSFYISRLKQSTFTSKLFGVR